MAGELDGEGEALDAAAEVADCDGAAAAADAGSFIGVVAGMVGLSLSLITSQQAKISLLEET
jgi:hypothetical protein